MAAETDPASPEHDIHSVQFMEEFTTCPLCERDFEDARMLPCLHTYCKSCIEKQQKQNGGLFKCELCRDGTSVKMKAGELPINAMVAKMKSLLLGDQGESSTESESDTSVTEKTCTSCEKGNTATSRCQDCREFMCKTCFRAHQSIKVLRDHTILTMEEWQKLKQKDPQVDETDGVTKLCGEHKEPISLFCDKCSALACSDCVVLYHKGQNHRCLAIKDAAVTRKQRLETTISEAQQTAAKFRGAWEILEKTRGELKGSAEQLRTEIKDAIKGEKDDLEDRQNRYLGNVDTAEKKNDGKIEGLIDRVEMALEKLVTAFELGESVLDFGDDYHLLSLDLALRSRLDVLKKLQPTLPTEDLSIIDLVEITGEEGVEQEEEDGPKSESTESADDESEDLGPVWELATTIGSAGSKEGQFDWCRGVSVSLDGHTVVADWGNDRVQVLDRDGKFLCLLNSDKKPDGKLSMPQDVACLPDGRFVAVDKSKFVRMYDPQGRFYLRFETSSKDEDVKMLEVELSCVTVDRRSRILVGDCKRNVITFHYTDGTLLKTLPVVGPSHIATDLLDRIVVSCPRKQKIRIMTKDGKLLMAVDSFGEKGKLKPSGVCCDSDNNIYVVHKERGGEKGVHMYNNKGRYVACVATAFREPFDVCLSAEGYVVVSDEDTVKVFRRKTKDKNS
ncbi:uncharacterized protein [Diadema antillarum]|uniref:uncharacterized protein n=1 Tax=Diadema antillarum TaxID=105358 RepID=UPI003A8B2B17